MARVSWILPVGPNAGWLNQTLDSVREQTFQDAELCVIYDGHCELNEMAVDGLRSSGFKNIRELVVNEPSGIVNALNLGISNTDSEYLARIDSDDVNLPERLSVQIEHMSRQKDLFGVGSSAILIDQDSRVIGNRNVVTGVNSVKRKLMWRNALIHPTVLMRRTALERTGLYNPLAKHCEDYELWLRMIALGNLDNVGRPLIKYRVHAYQTSRKFQADIASAAILKARSGAASTGIEKLSVPLKHKIWLAANNLRP